MDSVENSDTSGGSRPAIGTLFLIAWHLISLPFIIWATITGPGGMICGPSGQFIILFLGIPTDVILLLSSIAMATVKRKLIHAPLLINLVVLGAIVLTNFLKAI